MLSRAGWGKARSWACIGTKISLCFSYKSGASKTERNSKPVQHFSRVRRSLEGIQSVFFSFLFFSCGGSSSQLRFLALASRWCCSAQLKTRSSRWHEHDFRRESERACVLECVCVWECACEPMRVRERERERLRAEEKARWRMERTNWMERCRKRKLLWKITN